MPVKLILQFYFFDASISQSQSIELEIGPVGEIKCFAASALAAVV
jgi:hypothetical protein